MIALVFEISAISALSVKRCGVPKRDMCIIVASCLGAEKERAMPISHSAFSGEKARETKGDLPIENQPRPSCENLRFL